MFKLSEILAKSASELSAEEKSFLIEHAGELSTEDKAKFADVLAADVDMDAVKALVTEQISKATEEIASSIANKFLDGVAKQRAKALETGRKTVETPTAQQETRDFMKALFAGDTARLKALTTGTGSTSPDDAKAGYSVPTQLLAEVQRIMQVYGVARREMRYLPFTGPGNSRTIPVLGTNVSVSWSNEGAKNGQSQPKFTVVTQTLKKLTAITPMTEEILEDTALDLTGLIAELFAEAIAKEEDIQFLAGSGSPWTGVLNASGVNSVTVTGTGGIADMTADDLLAMIDATPAGALNGAKFYIHRTVVSKIRKLKDTTNNYIYGSPANGAPATVWGYPIVECEALPTATTLATNATKGIIFGNLRMAAILGDKQNIRVKLLDQATITDTDGTTAVNLAEQDMLAIRTVERVGYVLALPAAVTVLTV